MTEKVKQDWAAEEEGRRRRRRVLPCTKVSNEVRNLWEQKMLQKKKKKKKKKKKNKKKKQKNKKKKKNEHNCTKYMMASSNTDARDINMKYAVVEATTAASNAKDDDESSCCLSFPRFLNVFSFPLSPLSTQSRASLFRLTGPISVRSDHEGLIRVSNMHVLSLSLSLWVYFRMGRFPSQAFTHVN
jgi:hypothetical protein